MSDFWTIFFGQFFMLALFVFVWGSLKLILSHDRRRITVARIVWCLFWLYLTALLYSRGILSMVFGSIGCGR